MDIIIKNLNKRYNELTVLNQFDAVFTEGKITCIMGPSGAGKTTLIHILLGLVKADSGSITGLEDKKIAAVFQENRLCEGTTAVKNVKLVCGKKVTDHAIREEFHKVGLTGYEKMKAAELSGGMKRRVTLVRALMAESDILIMDEPFKGLDDALKQKVIEYVRKKTQGKTVLVVTHDKEEVTALGAELVLL